jgi:tetratricopeptide (TPR) repeat protein
MNAQVMPSKFFDFHFKLHTLENKEKIKLLKKTIKDNPNEPWYYVMLADYYASQRDMKNVIKYYEKSIELDSKFAAGHSGLARYLYENDSTQLENALTHINQAISLEYRGWNFHAIRANIYFRMKEYDLALKDAYWELNILGDIAYSAIEVIVKSLYAQKKDTELTTFLKKIDASKGIYGTEFTFFLGSLYENINDLKKACVCYHTAAESYVIMKEKIPSNIEMKLKNCKQPKK